VTKLLQVFYGSSSYLAMKTNQHFFIKVFMFMNQRS